MTKMQDGVRGEYRLPTGKGWGFLLRSESAKHKKIVVGYIFAHSTAFTLLTELLLSLNSD